jgi:myo-inositol 2-dehydrogenase/D-chiro-inositol 1-dehydrogenase
MSRSPYLVLFSWFLNESQGKRHVHTLLYRVPRARIVAVCSSLEHEVEWAKENLEYKEFGITVYNNYDEMLNHTDLQAVWVSTSTDVHSSQSLAAIDKGLHVLCEKPLSTDMAEVCLLYHLASSNSLRLIGSDCR